MKKIPLTKGTYAIVDDSDYDEMMKVNWYCAKSYKTQYAQRELYLGGGRKNRIRKTIQMHRCILGRKIGFFVDHINGNGLDNRRCNLRHVTASQSAMNRPKRSDSKNKYKGVCRKVNHKGARPVSYFCAGIIIDGKAKDVGYFKSELEAALKYDELALKHYGEYARLNFPDNTGVTKA